MSTALGGIYVVQILATGAFYIGRSSNLAHRRTEHFCDLRNNRHVNARLQQSYSEDGPQSLEFVVVALLPPEDLCPTEQRLLTKLYGHAKCLNLSRSSRGGSPGLMSPEARARMSARFLGKKRSPESVAKTTAGIRGLKRTREQNEANSARQRGKPLPAHMHEAARRANIGHKRSYGRVQSEEANQSRREKQKGRARPPEVVAKSAATMRARYAAMSPEERAVMQERMQRMADVRMVAQRLGRAP